MAARHLLLILVLASLAGCASSQSAMGPPPRPGQSVMGFTERLHDRPGYELYLRNDAEYPMTITSITIFECVNLAVWCETRELDIVLTPGQIRRVVVVEPDDTSRRWNFRWRWTHARGVAASARAAARDPAPEPISLEESGDVRTLLDPRGRFVNLVLPAAVIRDLQRADWRPEQVQHVTRLFYRSFDDEFDVLFLALADADEARTGEGRAFRSRQAAEGLGLSGGDRTEAFGSAGRLLSALFLSSHSTLDGPLPLHELAHTWGQYILGETGHSGHWGFSGVGGLLGGWDPGTLEQVNDSLWTAREEGRPGPFSLSGPRGTLRTYAPLELYLMGLLPPDSVPPVQIAEAADWVNVQEGTFRASRIRTVEVDELVARHGPRAPAYGEAPTALRAAYVVVSSEPLDDVARNKIDQDVEELSRPGPRELRWYLNFWEATGGRGRLVMDGLTEAVRDPWPDP